MNENPMPQPEKTDLPFDRDAATVAPGSASRPPNTQGSDGANTQPVEAVSHTSPLAPSSDTASFRVPTGAAFQKGRRFGDYELLEEIARGGMGVVFKARQTKLNRIVALKMIVAGELATQAAIERFFAEAEAAANLDHPGIVPIYEVNVCEGRQFFSMAFIDGGSLADRLTNGPLPVKQAAQLMIEVAEAVHYAHEKGVVHRDLKPANILLARVTGSTEFQLSTKPTGSGAKVKAKALAGDPFPTTPKITDFGLAKRTESTGCGKTAAGEILGTPSYMPPEQAAGKVDEVGPLSDVYSLGALLYATVTGRPPFQAASVMDTLVQVLEREPIRPSVLNPTIDRDLETICLKAMEKQSARRYASAFEFAEDLRRYLRHEPIVARRVSATGRAIRWCRRNRLAAAALAVASLLIFGVIFAGPAVAVREARLREVADEQRDIAEMLSREAALQSEEAQQQFLKTRQLLYDSQISLADREISAGHIRQARMLIDRTDSEMRGWEWRYLDNRLRGDEFWFNGHIGECRQIEFSADGRLLYSVGDDSRFYVWDVRETKRVWSLDLPGPGQSLAVHPITKSVVVATRTGETFEIDHVQQVRKPLALRFGPTQRIAFNHRGDRLAVAPASGPARIVEWPPSAQMEGAAPKSLELPNGRFNSVSFSPDDRWVVATGELGDLAIFEAETGKRHALLRGHFGSVKDAAFDRSGRRIVSAGWDTVVRIWDARDGRLLNVVRGGEYPVDSVGFTHEGDAIVAAHYDGSIRIWDIATGTQRIVHRGHNRFARCVRASPVDWLLASAGADGDIRFWDMRWSHTPEAVGQLPSEPSDIAFDSTGRFALAACTDKQVRVVDASAHRILGTLFSPEPPIAVWFESGFKTNEDARGLKPPGPAKYPFAVPRDVMATLSTTGQLVRWPALGAQPEIEKPSFEGKPLAARRFGDATAVATDAGNIYALAHPSKPPTLLGKIADWKPKTLAASEAAKLVAVGCERTLDGRNGLFLFALPDDKAAESTPPAAAQSKPAATFLNAIAALAIDAGRRYVAVGCNDTTLAMVDFDGKRMHDLVGHATPLTQLAFLAGEDRLVSASVDGNMKLWDLDTRLEVLSLTRGGLGLGIPKAGGRLLAGYWDLQLRCWSAEPRLESARRDAMRIRSHWAENCLSVAELRSTMRAQAGNDVARQRALEIAFDSLPMTDAECNGLAWRVAARQHMPRAMYLNADRLAQRALELAKSDAMRADAANTAGAVKYRLGDDQASIGLLEESDTLHRKRTGKARVEDLALLTLALRRVGASKQAAKYHAEMKALLANARQPLAELSRLLVEEVERND